MKQYNVLQPLYMSFYSRSLYRDVAANWGGTTFLYLFILLALSWITATYQLQTGLNQVYNRNADKIAAQIPVVTIKQGKLSTPENKPYTIYAPDSQEVIAVIDTSGRYTTLEQANAPILITETHIISQSKKNEIRTDQIPTTLNLVMDPKDVNSLIGHYLGYAWIIFFVMFLLCSYIYRIFQAFIYAVIGKLFSSICGSSLTYGQIILITMIALTPAIIIATILDAFAITFSFQWLCYFVLTMIYLFFGVAVNKR